MGAPKGKKLATNGKKICRRYAKKVALSPKLLLNLKTQNKQLYNGTIIKEYRTFALDSTIGSKNERLSTYNKAYAKHTGHIFLRGVCMAQHVYLLTQ